MPRVLVVVNPAASGFTGTVYRQTMTALGAQFEVEPAWPGSPLGAREVAAQAAGEGWDAVVAIGGDGVVHRVANGIAGTGTALGIIPAGTTNVVARILGIPGRTGTALEQITRGIARDITTAHIASDGAEVHGLFAVGMGYDAAVVESAEREPIRKMGLGALHYARSGLSVLWSQYRDKAPTLRVTADGDTVWAAAVMIQVLDPYTYLGRVPLRILRNPSGLAVAAIESLAPGKAVRIAARATSGRSLDKIPGVTVWDAVTNLEVLSDDEVPLQADGETLGTHHKVEVRPAPSALRVIC